MGHLDKRSLIDRGRKAGLGTSELYQALSTQRPEANESAGGLPDGNGFISEIRKDGQRIYRPVDANGH